MSEILKEIRKKYGVDIAVSGDEFLNRPKKIITVSPSLDIALGGGIPQGNWMIIGGIPKLGKSSTALSIAANAQKQGIPIRYFDVECRTKEMNLRGITGLSIKEPEFVLIRSSKDTILAMEDQLQIATDMMTAEDECLYIIDSFSLLSEANERAKGIESNSMGSGQKRLAQFCRTVAPIVAVKNHIVIGIVHVMANVSGYGAKLLEKSGNAVKYQADIKLIGTKNPEYITRNNVNVGQKITWMAECNALGAPPHTECSSMIQFGKGIDILGELISLGEDLGFIRKAGAWMFLDFLSQHYEKIGLKAWDDEAKKEYKAQGAEKLYELLEANPKVVELLRADITNMLKPQK